MVSCADRGIARHAAAGWSPVDAVAAAAVVAAAAAADIVVVAADTVAAAAVDVAVAEPESYPQKPRDRLACSGSAWNPDCALLGEDR